MSDLTQFRDHARFMADREHAPDCPPVRSAKSKPFHDGHGRKRCDDTDTHEPHDWAWASPLSGLEITWKCRGVCNGCNPPEYRALWIRLAAEIDAYLGAETEVEDLFGAMTAEPDAARAAAGFVKRGEGL